MMSFSGQKNRILQMDQSISSVAYAYKACHANGMESGYADILMAEARCMASILSAM